MTSIQTDKTKAEIVSEFEERGRTIKAKIDELVVKAESKSNIAKADYRNRISDLKAKYDKAQKKLGELRDAGASKWQNFKGDLETIWVDVETTARSLAH